MSEYIEGMDMGICIGVLVTLLSIVFALGIGVWLV